MEETERRVNKIERVVNHSVVEKRCEIVLHDELKSNAETLLGVSDEFLVAHCSSIWRRTVCPALTVIALNHSHVHAGPMGIDEGGEFRKLSFCCESTMEPFRCSTERMPQICTFLLIMNYHLHLHSFLCTLGHVGSHYSSNVTKTTSISLRSEQGEGRSGKKKEENFNRFAFPTHDEPARKRSALNKQSRKTPISRGAEILFIFQLI